MAAGKLPLHERALRLLAVRPRTRRELQTRLVRAGFDPHEVGAELDRLEEVGLVDDARFAAEFAEQALDRRLEGRRAVAAGLAAKGVDRRLIDQALQGASGDDGDRLARLAQARAGRLGTLPPEAAYRRLVSFLVRRGHEPSAARAAAARALRLAADASESA
ncbi:MAG: regulatory protein RecX [Actinomycetota bacterium]